MLRNNNKKPNWKLYLIPIWAVLVFVGVFGPLEASATAYKNFDAEWQVNYSFRFNPNAQHGAVYVEQVAIYGVPDTGARQLINTGPDEVDVPDANDPDIDGIYFGVAHIDDDYKNTCIGVSCSFSIFKFDPIAVNPIRSRVLQVPIDEFPLRTGTQQYKIIPVLDINFSPDRPFDSGTGSSFFSITWDTTVTQTYNAPETRIAKNPPVVGSVSFRSEQEEGVLGGLLISIVNVILTVVLGVVRAALTIIYSLLIGPVINGLLGGSPQLIAAEIPEFVRYGWVYVRDVMNLLFILILIFSGVATMLHIGEYGLKKTITRVVIVALAVNFSLVAGQIVLNFAQIMMNTFINPEVIEEIQIGISWDKISAVAFDLNAAQSIQGTAMLVFNVVYEIGILATLGALAVFLLIRLTAVWLLLILAPAAYVLYLFEPTQQYLGQWWHKFLSYAFFAPIMAFFIAVIARLVKSPFFSTVSIQGTGTFSAATVVLLQGVMVIVMLAFTLKLASQMGIAGADTVIGGAQKMWKTGFGVGGFAGSRLWGLTKRKWNEKTSSLLDQREGQQPPGFGKKFAFALLNPINAARGWQARTEELEHHAKEVATARGREVSEQFRTGGKLKIPYAQFAERHQENEYLKQYEGMSKEQLMVLAGQMKNMKGHEGEMRRRVLLKAAASGGQLDDILASEEFAGKYGPKEQTDKGIVYSQEILRDFLQQYLQGDHGLGEQALRFMGEDLEELGKKTGHWEYVGLSEFDVKNKRWEMRSEDQQADYAAVEYSKLGGRDQTKIAPHVLINLRKNEKGEFEYSNAGGELSKLSKAIYGKMGYGVLRESQHFQERLSEAVHVDAVDHDEGEYQVTEEEFKDIQVAHKTNEDAAVALIARAFDKDPRRMIESGGITVKVKIGQRVKVKEVQDGKEVEVEKFVTDEAKTRELARGGDYTFKSSGKQLSEGDKSKKGGGGESQTEPPPSGFEQGASGLVTPTEGFGKGPRT